MSADNFLLLASQILVMSRREFEFGHRVEQQSLVQYYIPLELGLV